MKVKFLKNKLEEYNGSRFLPFAHHPHCDFHENHLIRISGYPLCLGCACMYSGGLIGIPLSFLWNWDSLSFVEWILFHLLFLTPTIVQLFYQNKIFKIISRTLLGITSSSYLVSGVFFVSFLVAREYWIPIVISVFYVSYSILFRLRQLKPNDPCSTCTLGKHPVCEWNLPYLMKNQDYPIWKDLKIDLTGNKKLDVTIIK